MFYGLRLHLDCMIATQVCLQPSRGVDSINVGAVCSATLDVPSSCQARMLVGIWPQFKDVESGQPLNLFSLRLS